TLKIIPLLPPEEIFHSSSSSKFSNSSSVTMSPRWSPSTLGLNRNSPSTADHPAVTVSRRYVCHPSVVFPSNRERHSLSWAPSPTFSVFSVFVLDAQAENSTVDKVAMLTADFKFLINIMKAFGVKWLFNVCLICVPILRNKCGY